MKKASKTGNVPTAIIFARSLKRVCTREVEEKKKNRKEKGKRKSAKFAVGSCPADENERLERKKDPRETYGAFQPFSKHFFNRNHRLVHQRRVAISRVWINVAFCSSGQCTVPVFEKSELDVNLAFERLF